MYPDIQGWAAVAHAHLGHMTEARTALQQFYTDMRKRWSGKGRPTDEALRTWFAEVFPIRLEEDRRLISEGLEMIG